MSDAPRPAVPENWRALHAFGLPAGSIRALLALLVFGTIWALLVRHPNRELPDYLRDLMFIIMGHYFASRRRMDAADEPGPPPLFLPRGTIRVLLVLGFVGSAVLLYRQGALVRVRDNPGVVTLLLASGFLLGVVLRALGSWLSGGGRRVPRVVEDLRAAVSLGAAVLLVVLIWDQVFHFLPPAPGGSWHELRLGFGRVGPPQILAALVGFYFGSRS